MLSTRITIQLTGIQMTILTNWASVLSFKGGFPLEGKYGVFKNQAKLSRLFELLARFAVVHSVSASLLRSVFGVHVPIF